MKFYDRLTGFYIADTEACLFKGDVSPQSVRRELEKYILSVAGWRAVFAVSGEDEDNSGDVKLEDLVLISTAVRAFYDYLGKKNARIVIASDARPTGTLLINAAARTFISLGAELTHLYIASAPEIMSYSNDGYDGFFYISASHNPIGHNGYKFGANGGVYGKKDVDGVLSLFLSYVERDDVSLKAIELVDGVDREEYRLVLSKHNEDKFTSIDYYKDFVLKTAFADENFTIPFGIIAELNGSSRSVSIDIPFLNTMGAKVWTLNAQSRQIAHGIVPEGKNLEMCRKELERIHQIDKDYIIGYVPDNDGDRGNFVYFDDSEGKAKILHAQEVFALIAIIDLAHQVFRGEERPAIVANGPTSTRIDDMARHFGAEVFRADVGEANVVALADKKRSEGFQVHVCGEGSNGGIITDPARVRDPMNSIMSIAKLYSVPGLFEFMCEKLGICSEEVSLSVLINAIPKYTTTSAFASEGVMRVNAKEFEPLKRVYEELFLVSVDSYLSEEDNLYNYEIHQFEGIEDRVGFGPSVRNENSIGGYKVLFTDEEGNFSAYLWLSKSKTEPVMRILADVKGDNPVLHNKLLSWQKRLVERADSTLALSE